MNTVASTVAFFKSPRKIMLSALALVLLTIFLGSWYIVSETERAVILRNGKFLEVAEPGLHFKIPLLESRVSFSNETFTEVFPKLQAYSNDSQAASMRVSVTYMLPAASVEAAYREFKTLDNLVSRTVYSRVPEANEQVFGQFTAEKAVKERTRLSEELRKRVTAALGASHLRVVSVQLENVDFSDAYEKGIEARMLAEVEVRRIEQNEQREIVEARIKVVQNTAVADSNLALANAQAEGIAKIGAAEANVIRDKANALAQNSLLIQLAAVDKWDGKTPVQMVPGSAVPFVNMPTPTVR